VEILKRGKEILKQEVLALGQLADNLDVKFEEAVNLILKSKGRLIVMGIGKSGIIGRKIAATMASTGTRSYFVHPSEAYHGDLGMIGSEDIVLGISNSGETDELIRLIPFFKENRNKLVTITNQSESTLAKAADVSLVLGITKEACPYDLAPTTSTTLTLALGDALSICLMEAKEFKPENFARFHPGGRLGRRLLSTVENVMQKENLPFIQADESFENVLKYISEGKLGLGIVLDAGKLLGVITDGDLRRLLLSHKEKALSMKAREYCSQNPILIPSSLKLTEVERMMNEKKVTSFLVGTKDMIEGVLHIHHL
jgi:arabinose-5-phosphate isomerase